MRSYREIQTKSGQFIGNTDRAYPVLPTAPEVAFLDSLRAEGDIFPVRQDNSTGRPALSDRIPVRRHAALDPGFGRRGPAAFSGWPRFVFPRPMRRRARVRPSDILRREGVPRAAREGGRSKGWTCATTAIRGPRSKAARSGEG